MSGVGGIEAEAVMLGQAISMVLPKVVGYKITGKIGPLATSTDVVLTITKVQFTDEFTLFVCTKSDTITGKSLKSSRVAQRCS